MIDFKSIITKLGITWSTIVVTILCVMISILISFVIGQVMDTRDFGTLFIAAIICPALIAPPVVYVYAKLNVCLEESKKNQEEMNALLVEFNKELSNAFDQVKDQNHILKICKVCQDIRDTRGHWITTTKEVPESKD